ncbi:hypothetical protein BCR39DRAFT_534331 [Naematelia encephala]|uniref:Nucleic acid-binding protein n=1 Tax=Naematelia encephala TaxID=71784 RepID=A0A1Y2B1I4_9TREE|nr:hypothetical protein BCR39DRAFT_534331 [Naematelia encephala]
MFTAARLAPALKASTRAFSTSRVAADVSKLTLVGRLGADPTLRTTKDGKPYYTYIVATQSGPSTRDESGNFVDAPTSWHTVFSFSENQHQSLARLGKGSTVYVEADLEMRESSPINDQVVPPRVLLRQLSLRSITRSKPENEPETAASE